MTTDPFTEATRAEGQARIAAMLEVAGASDDIRAWFRAGFEKGAEWARTHITAQEPTDADAQVYLAAFSEDLPPDTEWTPDTIERVKRGLRAARRDEETP